MRSTKLCHFQWPWMNPNPVFKARPLFDDLQNGCRYGNSYYGRRIRNRTQAFEWHQFQWPWVTCKPDFKITILFNVTRKWYEIELLLQWRTNRKSYIVNRTAPFSVTFKDPKPTFQDDKIRPFFDAEYLQNGCRYSHSHYGRRIGNRTQAFKWYYFQWHWVTLNLDLKVTVVDM